MVSFTSPTPEFEGQLSQEGWRHNLIASINHPHSGEEVQIPVKKLATGLFSSFTNLLLAHQIDNNSYTKIHLRNPNGTLTELYAETSKIQRLISRNESFPAEATASSSNGSNSLTNTFPTEGLSDPITTAIKTNKLYFELSDSTQMIQSHEGSYIFHDNKWRRILTTPEKGTHSQVLLCQEIAFKFLHTPNEKGWTDIKRSESILQRVNPDGLAIGIQKRPITELALRNITTYHIEPSGVITTSNKHAVSKLEEPFLSDCIDALFLIQDTEIPSIAACLVQGSITLIGNGIYPFDVKLDNIGYLGNGRAVHIDLGGSYDISEDNWELLLPTHTSKYNIKDEALTALENTSSESKKQQLEKIHIFQLGIALFGLAAKTLPYNILDSNGCIAPFPTEVFPEEQKDQLRNTNIYSENQINMIISMIAKIPEERPSLQEIQSVFPVDLIL